VVEPTDDGFTVAVIPHTAAVTTLGSAGPGHRVNLEVDIMAKHVERLMAAHTAAPAADDIAAPAADGTAASAAPSGPGGPT
jgi:riboflavin synthase